MISYVFTIILKLLNIPKLSEVTATFSKPLINKLQEMEREFLILICILTVLQILGFVAIIMLLEDGFHWNYLIKF